MIAAERGGLTGVVMAGRKTHQTRAEIRSRNAQVPAARVYGLMVSDPYADVWRSNLAVFASSPEEADECWHRLGLVRGYERLPHRETDNADFAVALARPGVVFLRRAAYPGDEPWMALPADYRWPHESVARTSREGLLPGELARWPTK